MIHLKLDATDSTNSFLRNLARESELENWTVVSAGRQTRGRGQQGSFWFSDEYKNLTFSILVKDSGIRAQDQFLLNCAVSTGVYRVLKESGVPRLQVKWPNDIMSGSFKIGGVLIENSVMNDTIGQSIIGIGLNVNQEEFSADLPAAASMFSILDRTFDLDRLLMDLVNSIRVEFQQIGAGKAEMLKRNYEDALYRRNTPMMFREPGGEPFMGKILGVSDRGLLIVELENGSTSHYASKEIQYI